MLGAQHHAWRQRSLEEGAEKSRNVPNLLSSRGRPVAVGNKGLLLLKALLRKPGETVPKPELMDAAWPEMAVEESNLSVQIAALRKLVGPAPNGSYWIATIPRVGYRFVGLLNGTERGLEQRPEEREMESSRKPVILVLPFRNIGGDHAQDSSTGLPRMSSSR
jgi:DNA-binding winged helix-turn-helix (wHTH) protein